MKVRLESSLCMRASSSNNEFIDRPVTGLDESQKKEGRCRDRQGGERTRGCQARAKYVQRARSSISATSETRVHIVEASV